MRDKPRPSGWGGCREAAAGLCTGTCKKTCVFGTEQSKRWPWGRPLETHGERTGGARVLIARDFIIEWRREAPWVQDFQQVWLWGAGPVSTLSGHPDARCERPESIDERTVRRCLIYKSRSLARGVSPVGFRGRHLTRRGSYLAWSAMARSQHGDGFDAACGQSGAPPGLDQGNAWIKKEIH